MVPKIGSVVRVDGFLEEEAWRGALVVELPYEVDPGENIPAPVRTECLIAYDNHNLFVAFRAYDPDPSRIRAHLSDRDKAFQDDFVGILLDTFNSQRRGFEFFVNPLGVQMDAVWNEVGGGGENFAWDAIWNAAGRITDEGYTVEIAIPFAQLQFPRREGLQTWGFIASRVYPRSLRHQILSVPWNRSSSCVLCQAGKLTGFQGIRPGRALEFDPTVTLLRTDARNSLPQRLMVPGNLELSPGLSARWRVTPNLSLDAAVNPDFSQVESDVAQLDVNIRFALFFPEKRPFFLEGADLFETPLRAVYTRTVADPSWGLKLTGKEGRHAIGVLLARDRFTNLVFPSNQGSSLGFIQQPVTTAVFRYRRDLGQASTLGVLLATREGSQYHNRMYGVDGHLRLAPADTVRFQLLRSHTVYPPTVAANFRQAQEPFSGYAASFSYTHDSRNWDWWVKYEDAAPGFRADTGFFSRVDARTTSAGAQYVIWGEPGDWYTRLSFALEGAETKDHSGVPTDEELSLRVRVSGPLQSQVGLRLSWGRELFEGVNYEKDTAVFFLVAQPTENFNLSFSSDFGDQIDYANSRRAQLLRLRPALNCRFGEHLNLQLEHVRERLDVGGSSLFVANLTQVRLLYQFSVRTLVRAILQYTDIARNPELYTFKVESESRHLFAQLLFSYKLNPQSVVFVGYSDNRSGGAGRGLIQTDRTLFLKIGYALLL